MFDGFEAWILGMMQALFDQWGWAGVAGLMAFENATSITPSEVILGLAGWFLLSAHDRPFSIVFLGGLYAAAGSVVGASITYWTARIGGRPLIDRMAGWLHLDRAHLDRAEAAFQQRGAWVVLFGRMLPGIRTLISIPAGLARMRFTTFGVTTFIGAYLWCTLLIGLGYFLGEEWELFSALFKRYSLALSGLGLFLVAAWFAFRWLARRDKRETVQEECA